MEGKTGGCLFTSADAGNVLHCCEQLIGNVLLHFLLLLSQELQADDAPHTHTHARFERGSMGFFFPLCDLEILMLLLINPPVAETGICDSCFAVKQALGPLLVC